VKNAVTRKEARRGQHTHGRALMKRRNETNQREGEEAEEKAAFFSSLYQS